MTDQDIAAYDWRRNLSNEDMRAIIHEGEMYDEIKEMARIHREAITYLWGMGDGYGGGIMCMIADEQGLDNGFRTADQVTRKRKRTPGRLLARQVMERDKYRCVQCGTHEQLCCDHIHPYSKGGETVLENLQTLCSPCNSRKGVRS